MSKKVFKGIILPNENIVFTHIRKRENVKLEKTLKKSSRQLDTVYDQSGHTPLTLACELSNEEAVVLLIKYKHNVNYSNGIGMCPIHYAAQLHSDNIFKLILNNRADINAKNASSQFALHFAIKEQRVTIVKLLLDFECKINPDPNSIASHPIDLAQEIGSQVIFDLIQSKMLNRRQRRSSSISDVRNHGDHSNYLPDDIRNTLQKFAAENEATKKEVKHLRRDLTQYKRKSTQEMCHIQQLHHEYSEKIDQLLQANLTLESCDSEGDEEWCDDEPIEFDEDNQQSPAKHQSQLQQAVFTRKRPQIQLSRQAHSTSDVSENNNRIKHLNGVFHTGRPNSSPMKLQAAKRMSAKHCPSQSNNKKQHFHEVREPMRKQELDQSVRQQLDEEKKYYKAPESQIRNNFNYESCGINAYQDAIPFPNFYTPIRNLPQDYINSIPVPSNTHGLDHPYTASVSAKRESSVALSDSFHRSMSERRFAETSGKDTPIKRVNSTGYVNTSNKFRHKLSQDLDIYEGVKHKQPGNTTENLNSEETLVKTLCFDKPEPMFDLASNDDPQNEKFSKNEKKSTVDKSLSHQRQHQMPGAEDPAMPSPTHWMPHQRPDCQDSIEWNKVNPQDSNQQFQQEKHYNSLDERDIKLTKAEQSKIQRNFVPLQRTLENISNVRTRMFEMEILTCEEMRLQPQQSLEQWIEDFLSNHIYNGSVRNKVKLLQLLRNESCSDLAEAVE